MVPFKSTTQCCGRTKNAISMPTIWCLITSSGTGVYTWLLYKLFDMVWGTKIRALMGPLLHFCSCLSSVQEVASV